MKKIYLILIVFFSCTNEVNIPDDIMSKDKMIEFENLKNSNKPYIKDLEKAAIKVINSGWYILGNEVREFEAEFAKYLGVKYCVGVASGLDALILSIEALSFLLFAAAFICNFLIFCLTSG